MKKKIMTMAIAAALLCAAGCAGEKGKDVSSTFNGEISFPVEEPITLTIWRDNSLFVVDNYKEMGCYKEMEKATGIAVDFIHPVAGQVSEQFNVMIASGEYPDIIESVDGNYQGGRAKAYEDGVILEMSELVEKYAPNFTALCKEYPEVMYASQNDKGQLFELPFIRGGSVLRTFRGPIVRADLLEKYGLSAPETIDEWHTVLKTFKDNGVEYPFTSTSAFFKTEVFAGAYGIPLGWFVEDGVVKYGYYDERFKAYMQTMADWYSEGLIDPEIMTNDSKTVDSKMLSGKVGAMIGTVGNSIGGYISEKQKTDPEFDLQAASYPTLEKGGRAYIIQREDNVLPNMGSSITTSCKNPEYATAYLDYAFSKEGHMMFNFGVEGESYEMIDGYPTFTEVVTNNPDGLPMNKAGSLYARSFTMGTFVQDPKYADTFYGQQRQKEATQVWTKDVDYVAEKNIAYKGTLTPAESAEITPMQNEVNTFIGENFMAWLMGTKSLDNFDEYLAHLKDMGIEDIIKIRQEAYDRYIEKFPEMKNSVEYDVSDYYWK